MSLLVTPAVEIEPLAEHPMAELSLPATLDPTDWHGFRRQAHRMLDDMVDYIEQIRQRPVWQPPPGSKTAGGRERLRTGVPEQPTELADVHGEFMRDVLPYAL